jgi:hypothetical protein
VNDALFVYYKIEESQHAHWLQKVRDFQRQLAVAHPTLELELMQRPEASSEKMETWMEIYRHPSGITDAMILSIQELAKSNGLPDKRACEVFIRLV